jgi:hypothetical protein
MDEKAGEMWYSYSRIWSGAVVPQYMIKVSVFRHTNNLFAPSISRIGERIIYL